jgi:hypothetical protein
MRKLIDLFTKHPGSVGETYFQHFRIAIKYGFTLLILVPVVFIHALLPFIFQDTASSVLKKMIGHIESRQQYDERQ